MHLVGKRYYENQSNKLNPVKHAKLVFKLQFLYWLKPYPESFHHLHVCLHLLTALNHEQTITAHFSSNKQHTCIHLFCTCLYIGHWVITWQVATKAFYVQRNELLQSARDFMQFMSADRNASGESAQDTALTNIKTMAKLQALRAKQD